MAKLCEGKIAVYLLFNYLQKAELLYYYKAFVENKGEVFFFLKCINEHRHAHTQTCAHAHKQKCAQITEFEIIIDRFIIL